MDFLPVFFNSRGQKVLVVGGGHIALRKVSLLLRCGVHVRLVAPEVIAELSDMLDDNSHEIIHRDFQEYS